MQTQFVNPESTRLYEETASSDSPQKRINRVAEEAAEKSTKAGLHSGMGYNQLFSKYLASRGLQSS